MRRRHTVGTQLAWLVVLATTLGMLAFSGIAAGVIWLDERDDHRLFERPRPGKKAEGGKKGGGGDDVLDEIVEDIGAAVLFATPFGVVVAVLAARWAARRVTRRLDGLIATAAQMTAADLRARLPLSARGDELDGLSGSLNQVFDRIDEGIAALRRFAADASHELRTPLAVVINELEVARRRPREVDAWQAVADRALDELRRMAELVEALLHGARVGAFDLAAEPIDVDLEVEAAAARWRDDAAAAGVALEVAAASGVTSPVDARGLHIVIGNLVGNALRHSPRGGTVVVRARPSGARVRIEVDDQGPGVPAAERERVFAPLGRAEPAGPEPKRIGLGLAISRRIVQAHGGTIAIEDAPGGGARFAIELPIALTKA